MTLGQEGNATRQAAGRDRCSSVGSIGTLLVSAIGEDLPMVFLGSDTS